MKQLKKEIEELDDDRLNNGDSTLTTGSAKKGMSGGRMMIMIPQGSAKRMGALQQSKIVK